MCHNAAWPSQRQAHTSKMDDTLASPSQFIARTAHSVTFLATPYVSPPTVAAVWVPCPAAHGRGGRARLAVGTKRSCVCWPPYNKPQ